MGNLILGFLPRNHCIIASLLMPLLHRFPYHQSPPERSFVEQPHKLAGHLLLTSVANLLASREMTEDICAIAGRRKDAERPLSAWDHR
jgi:hypothetical protein